MSRPVEQIAPDAPVAATAGGEPGDALRVQDLDLNLLKTFRAVFQEKHVGRAALRLGVTQPSVSYGLGRLRLMVRDALFVRTGIGVEPTPRARRLAASVDAALAILQDVLDEGASFVPETSQRVFRIQMSDFAASAFLPALLAAFDARAPGAIVEALHLDETQLNQALESGRIDFALGHFIQTSEHFRRAALLREHCVLLMSDHTRARLALPDGFTLDAFPPAGLRLVAITSHPQSMALLDLHGLMPRGRAALPDFLVLPALLRQGDHAAVVPQTVVRSFAMQWPCTQFPVADAMPWSVNAYWHRRFDVDPGHRWLRALLVELFGIGERQPYDTWLAAPR